MSRTAGDPLTTPTAAEARRPVMLVTIGARRATAPAARNRGSACINVTGMVVRTDAAPTPDSDACVEAVATIRYVVSPSGSVTAAVAFPASSVSSEPIQNASVRKSVRTGSNEDVTVAVWLLTRSPIPNTWDSSTVGAHGGGSPLPA